MKSLTILIVATVQLKCNLMPARGLPGEKVRVNLQTGACKGAGARNVLHQPGANLWRPFYTSFLNTLVLTIIRATDVVSFIHSSLVNHRGLLSITILLARDQTF